MKSIKIAFKHSSQTFEANSADGARWNLTKPQHSVGDFAHVAGQVSLLIRKHVPEVVKFLAQEDCVLSNLSFGRKFASLECEPQELRQELQTAVQEIFAYNVEVAPVAEVVEATEEAA